jgi:hypothetical protein
MRVTEELHECARERRKANAPGTLAPKINTLLAGREVSSKRNNRRSTRDKTSELINAASHHGDAIKLINVKLTGYVVALFYISKFTLHP